MVSRLLSVGPATCSTIPPRLFLDMVERGSPSTSITPSAAARLSKSIAEWLLLDVIGLSTGD